MKRIIFLLMMIVLTARPAWAVMDKQEAISKFVMGNQAYKEGDYQKAIEEYQAIIGGGRESGPVYYNLANAYFKNGKSGYALLNYHRSRELIPRDSDLNFNFNYARSLIKKNADESKRNLFDTLIQGHIHFYTIDEMVIMITVLTAIGVFLHLLAKFLKWKNLASKFLRGIVLILILVQSAGLYLKMAALEDLAIMVQSSDAKFEPNVSGTVHFELSEGIPVKIVHEKDGWVKIRRDDGRLGWVEKTALERVVAQSVRGGIRFGHDLL